jgi:hypothetical protein
MNKNLKYAQKYGTYVVRSLSQKQEVYHLPTIFNQERGKSSVLLQARPVCGIISERFEYILRSKVDENKICNKCIVNSLVRLMKR